MPEIPSFRTAANTLLRVAPFLTTLACDPDSSALDHCMKETSGRLADVGIQLSDRESGCVEVTFTTDNPDGTVDNPLLTCFVVDKNGGVWNAPLEQEGDRSFICGLEEGDEYGLYCATVDAFSGECEGEIKITDTDGVPL